MVIELNWWGSLNATKLVWHIIQTISEVKPTKNNAYNAVLMLNSLSEQNPESDIVIPS